VRPGVRGKAVPHAGHLPAALVARSPGLRRPARSGLRLQRAAARRVRPARRARARGGLGQRVLPAVALHVRHSPAGHDVPAVPAQELGAHGRHGGGLRRARRRHLATGELSRARRLWCGHGVQHFLGGPGGAAALVRPRRRVPGDVEWVLDVGVRGLEGVCYVVGVVGCHGVLGELVLLDIDFPHCLHEECRASCGCTVYLVGSTILLFTQKSQIG